MEEDTYFDMLRECKVSLAMDLAKVLDNDSKCWMLLENMGTPCLISIHLLMRSTDNTFHIPYHKVILQAASGGDRKFTTGAGVWGNLAKSCRGIAPDKSCAFCLESDAKSCVTTERKR